MITSRRGFLTGMAALIAAPAIVRVASIMPVKTMPLELEIYGSSPSMMAIKDLEYLSERSAYLQAQAFPFRVSKDAWQRFAVVDTNGVWRVMPGGQQNA